MAELGTRFTIERVKIGHSLPKAARACALLGGPHCSATPPTTRKTFSGPVSSELLRPVPEGEGDVERVGGQGREGLTVVVGWRALLGGVRGGPVARAQGEEGHLID